MNAQIVPEVYLDMEILLERKIGNHDCCILSVLSTDHHSCSIQRYESSVITIFDYYVKVNFSFGGLPLERFKFRKGYQIFLINIFL